MITDDNLLLARAHSIGGVQRIYRFKSGYGLSLINGPIAHSYPFAWEAAVLKNVSEDGRSDGLTYDTPLTQDVEVFMTDEEANDFIRRAADVLGEWKQ
jgi:hypothetical protein